VQQQLEDTEADNASLRCLASNKDEEAAMAAAEGAALQRELRAVKVGPAGRGRGVRG
jgi:hypothetical protein